MSKLSEKSLEDLSREELEKLKLYSEFEKNQAQQEKARQESHAVRMRVVWQPVTVLLGIIVAAFLIWNYTQPIFEKETTLTKLDSAIAMKRIELKQAVLDSSNRALKLSNARFWTSFEQYTNRLDTILSQSNSELARTRTEIAEERSKRPPNHTLLSAWKKEGRRYKN